MKFKKLFMVLVLAFSICAPAYAGVRIFEDNQDKGVFDSVSFTTNLDVSVVGGVANVALTDDVNVNKLLAAQYIKTQYYIDSTRPASGAPVGSIIVKGGAANRGDCGVVAGGSAFAVCISDGTNWIPLVQQTNLAGPT